MAKGKGTRTKYVSKGERPNVSKTTRKLMRRNRDQGQAVLDKMDAYWKGLNPWITIINPDKNQTNKRFIRVKANDLYGHPKKRKPFMFGGGAASEVE